jgi:hypothetical protein
MLHRRDVARWLEHAWGPMGRDRGGMNGRDATGRTTTSATVSSGSSSQASLSHR